MILIKIHRNVPGDTPTVFCWLDPSSINRQTHSFLFLAVLFFRGDNKRVDKPTTARKIALFIVKYVECNFAIKFRFIAIDDRPIFFSNLNSNLKALTDPDSSGHKDSAWGVGWYYTSVFEYISVPQFKCFWSSERWFRSSYFFLLYLEIEHVKYILLLLRELFLHLCKVWFVYEYSCGYLGKFVVKWSSHILPDWPYHSDVYLVGLF